MEQADLERHHCAGCETELSLKSNFCKNCGLAVNHNEIKSSFEKRKDLQSIALFFSLELTICVSAFIIEEITLEISIFFDLIMAVIAILFFASAWKENKMLIKWPNFSVKTLLSLVMFTIVASVAVQFLVTQLNRHIFQQEYSYYPIYVGHQYGNYIMIASVALFPAIFEELAYRGFLMQKLILILNPKEAIYLSSILFFIVHFSMISFFWMLPFAFLLGYVRIKYNTLWYGIAMHFCFNLMTCLWEIYAYHGY